MGRWQSWNDYKVRIRLTRTEHARHVYQGRRQPKVVVGCIWGVEHQVRRNGDYLVLIMDKNETLVRHHIGDSRFSGGMEFP